MNASNGGGISTRLQIEAAALPPALRRVAGRVLSHPDHVVGASIGELAADSKTSAATITRFCRELGFDGYAAFRLALAAELGRAAHARWDSDIDRNIGRDDPIDKVLKATSSADTLAVSETAYHLDTAAVDTVASAIAAAGRVELFGLGSSGNAARELSFRLERIRVPCWFRSDSHTALTGAALLEPGDVAMGISHSGRSVEVVETLSQAASKGALTVAITSFGRSPLAKVADVVLRTQIVETSFRMAALSALHAQLLVLDLIYVVVAQRTYDRTTAAFEVTAQAVAPHRLPSPDPDAARPRDGWGRNDPQPPP